MTDKIHSIRDLKVWQLGMGIVREVYQLTKHFPQNEQYALTSQMRRSAVSIPSNIAEGFARKHAKEYKQFLYVCLGSCAELETQIEIAGDQNYIDGRKKAELIEKIECLCRMTMSLSKCL